MAQRERKDPEKALLDAAERLLERDGFIGISTRKVAKEAGINPALVHYYFDSIEDLCAHVISRFSEDLIERQRQIFTSDSTLAKQWRLATEPLRSNVGRRRMKVWFELSAMAVNQPALLRRMVEINAEWRRIIREAVEREAERRGSGALGSFSVEATAALMSVVLKGLYWENLQEFHEGHDELIAAADRLLSSFEPVVATTAARGRRRRVEGLAG
ncbi:MAG TPA: TetR family transcriptional regulator [Acidimicrobiia bacterium]|nr:TetR family transcriptional regulator [Acidimicrobiia bacterium]